MKEIGIYLAASAKEFELELEKLNSYIHSLNDIYVKFDCYFRLYKELSDEQLREKVEKSDFFIILFYKNVEDDTVQEFEVALEEFRKKNAPKIVTYFKELEEGENVSADVKGFMERLDKELGHFYSLFQNIDTVKLGMLLEIMRTPGFQVKLEFQNGKVLANHKEVSDISLENIPYYAKNEMLQMQRAEREELEQKALDFRLKLQEDPDNEQLRAEYLSISKRKNACEEELHAMEMDILAMASKIHEMTVTGEYLTQRAKRAIELFQKGEYEKALVILDDVERRNEVTKLKERSDELKKEFMAYVKEIEIKISSLKAMGVTQERADKIVVLYEEAAEIVFAENLDEKILIEYGAFLASLKKYKQAYAFVEKLNCWMQVKGENRDEIDFLLAHICDGLGDFVKAKIIYKKMIENYHNLKNDIPEVYESIRTYKFFNIGIIEGDEDKYGEAESGYQKEIIFHKKIKIEYNNAYQEEIATVSNELACVYREEGRYKEAEKLCKESVDIFRKLNIEYPGIYEEKIACSIANLASCYGEMENFEKAVVLYSESLEIYLKLSEIDSKKYEEIVARISSDLATAYGDLKCYEKAVEFLKESLRIYRKLSGEYFELYAETVGELCEYQADLYKAMKFYEEAKDLYSESLNICQELNEKNPKEYEEDIIRITIKLEDLY